MQLPKMSTLLGVAGGCGVGVSAMLLLMNKQRDGFANQANFVQKAVQIMTEEHEVKQLLGEPILVGKASFNDGWSRLQRLNAQVRLPIKGQNDTAFLYAYARKKSDTGKLYLYKLEATFGKIQGKKLILMDRTNEEDTEVQDTELRTSPDASTATSESAKIKEGTEKTRRKPMTKEEIKEEMRNWSLQPKSR